MHTVVITPAAIIRLDTQVHSQMHFEVRFAGAHLAALVAYPLGLVEVYGVHVVFQVRAVRKCFLAQWTFGHKLRVV